MIPLIHAVHMDPTLWKDPEAFNPQRFLNEDGTKTVRPDFFIPFGVGRRMCLGDVLAKAELFLFFSSMLHVFNLQMPEGAELPGLCGQAGVTVSPQSFKVKKLLSSKNLRRNFLLNDFLHFVFFLFSCVLFRVRSKSYRLTTILQVYKYNLDFLSTKKKKKN